MERIQGRFGEMAVNQNTVLMVHLGMFATSGIGLEMTSRGKAITKTSNKPLHNVTCLQKSTADGVCQVFQVLSLNVLGQFYI